MTERIGAAALALFAFVCSAAAARAQAPRPSTAVVPADITVGDVFRAAIRIEAPAGAEVVFPDTLLVPADVEAAGRREVRIDSAAAGSGLLIHTAVYPLTAWRPDTVSLPSAAVAVRGAAGEWVVEARFAPFAVASVLPADTTGIEPKQAKDVIGPNRVWWPLLLLALLLAALIALAIWLWRRRRARPAAVLAGPDATPRERAFARIDEAIAAGWIEAGRIKEFYTAIAEALRLYVAELERGWSPDLTTSELVGRMRASGAGAGAAELAVLLERADLVKFARARPDRTAALMDARSARGWVERFDGPPAELERAA